MLKYISRRILQMIPTVLGVILLTFVLFNVLPNDLALQALGKKVSPQRLEDFDVQRGFDKPLFFGTRATTRAYEDVSFADGTGRWRSYSNVVYSSENAVVKINPSAKINPLAFELDPRVEYEWKIRYRGAGSLAGQVLNSEKWTTEKVRFMGGVEGGFMTDLKALEIKTLELRKVMANPFNSQLWFYLKQLARGDLGKSELLKQPVSGLLKDGVLTSLSLTIPIFLIGVVLSVAFALVCAFFRNTWIDRSLVVFSVALMSINYLVYIVAGQYILAYKQGWFPVWGYESWRYLILPVTIGVISGLGANIRFYRTVMLDEMYKDYVRTAFAKGVSKPRVLFVHVLKNAMIPIITNVVIAIPYLYTGSLLLEKFFGIPGLGYLSITAILSSDVDIVRAVVLIGALLFVVCNLLTDLCYAAVDPRVKLK